jgi:hypothetical protein
MGFIFRYNANNAGMIEVVNFKKHQSPHHTEKKSQLPAPVNSPLDHGGNPPDSLIPDSLIPDSGFSDSQIQDQNTKASTSLRRSDNLISNSECGSTPTPKTNTAPLREKAKADTAQRRNGRPVVTNTELEWIRQAAARLGLPQTAERDHAIGAQYITACGCSMEPIFALLDARMAEGTGGFKSIGEVFAAAIAHSRYLDGRNLQ